MPGNLSFSEPSFGTGNVFFNKSEFNNGDIDFEHTDFGKGSVFFQDCKFGNGDISFNNAILSDGRMVFARSIFCNGKIDFERTTFTNCSVDFDRTFLGNGNFSFQKSTVDGSFDFTNVTVGVGSYNFEKTDFKNRVSFSGLSNTESLEQLSFKYSNFEKSLDISGNFNFVIDLTNIKITNQVSVANLKCKLNRTNGICRKAIDPVDATRFRRLKEISDSNKNHEKALYFHAQEMKAKRWHEIGFFPSLLDKSFSAICDYGSNISRPFIALIANIFLFSLIYSHLPKIKSSSFWDALIFSASNSFSFIPISRGARNTGLEILFGGNGEYGYWIYSIIGLQSILSLTFIFLIGLGLRNRFRI
ncbi:hypothetical protein [Photobacterium kasasachensis]|uniref:hypothetical protein n=1 Tax=Photobacterium kasasachensis TaxID=2910240 RepID=UPI003D0DF990